MKGDQNSMPANLNAYLEFALRTAWEAGQITLRYFQSGVKTEWKADETPVTAADRLSEEFIRSQIESRYPSQAILGEEYGGSVAESGACWVIDPLDGTRSFVRGVPLYAVLIGVVFDGASRVGVAHFPALRETIWAASGLGCFVNSRPARCSSVERLEAALLCTTDLNAFGRYGKGAAWQRLAPRLGRVVGWGDAYGYLLAASGRADIMLDAIMETWDCGPFPVILAEAGGYFGDWRGTATISGREGLATNLALLPQVIALLNNSEIG
jgi:myo-inositol-1(or 4)-monophosphatase